MTRRGGESPAPLSPHLPSLSWHNGGDRGGVDEGKGRRRSSSSRPSPAPRASSPSSPPFPATSTPPSRPPLPLRRTSAAGSAPPTPSPRPTLGRSTRPGGGGSSCGCCATAGSSSSRAAAASSSACCGARSPPGARPTERRATPRAETDTLKGRRSPAAPPWSPRPAGLAAATEAEVESACVRFRRARVRLASGLARRKQMRACACPHAHTR